MGKIKIDVGAVISAGENAKVAKNKVETAKESVHDVHQRLDHRVTSRSGIGDSLLSLNNQLNEIVHRIERIHTTVDLSANNYWQSDAALNTSQTISGHEMLGIINTALRTELSDKFNVLKEIAENAHENWENRMEEIRANRDPLPSLRNYTLVYDFIESKSDFEVAVLYSFSRGDILTGVKSLYNSMIGRDDMNDTIFKNHIKKTIALTIDKEESAALGKRLLEEIDQTLIGSVDGWNKVVEAVENGGEQYKYLKYMDKNAFNNLGHLLDCGQEGIECFEIMVSDYSEEIAKLTILRDGLAQSGCEEYIIVYVDEIINEYNNKFNTITDRILDFTIDKSFDVGADAAATMIPGGQLFAFASASQKLIWNLTGAEAKGDQLMDIYASCCYSGYVVNAYESYANKLRSGNYTPEDVEKCEALFEIAKEMKIQEYNDIRDFSDSQMYNEIDEAIDDLRHTSMLSERFVS